METLREKGLRLQAITNANTARWGNIRGRHRLDAVARDWLL